MTSFVNAFLSGLCPFWLPGKRHRHARLIASLLLLLLLLLHGLLRRFYRLVQVLERLILMALCRLAGLLLRNWFPA